MKTCKEFIFIIIPVLLFLGVLHMIVPMQSSQATVESTDLSDWQFYQTDKSVRAIWGWPDNTVIAAGYYNSDVGGYQIYRYDGTAWTESVMKMSNGQNMPDYGYISDLWGVSPDDVYAVTRGTYRDSYGGYYCGGAEILHYNGTSWQVVAYDQNDSGFTSIWGTGPSDIYTVGLDCGVTPFVAHYNGVNWTEEELTFALNYESSANDIHGNASGDIYIAGEWGIPKLDKTAEYTNWPDAGPWEFSTQWQGIWAAPDGHVFVVGYSKTVAHFDGTSWESMDTEVDMFFNKIWGRSSNDVYAVGNSVYHYDGSSWTKMLPRTDVPNFYSVGVWGSPTGGIFIAGNQGIISSVSSGSPDDGEPDYPLVKERCDAECGTQDPNSEWDGISLGDCECKCKNDYHVELESAYNYPLQIGSYNTRCASNDCRQLCNDMEYYEYKSGSVDKGDCECSCVDGAERNIYNYCRPVDDLWTFLNGDCRENTYPTDHDVFETVCSCEYGFADCDRNPASGCETSIKLDRFNCGYCDNACKNLQQCYNGACVNQDYYDAVTSVADRREQTEWEEKRKNDQMQEVLTALQKNFLENEFEFLWGTAGELFEEGKVPSNFFNAVSIYFDFFKKPSDHIDVRAEVDEQLNAGNIDAKQAEMIKQLDAVIKASSVLSGFTGRGAMYQQGTLLDTANAMVIKEAIRSAKYSYCRDLLVNSNPDSVAEQLAVDECLARQVSAGVFK